MNLSSLRLLLFVLASLAAAAQGAGTRRALVVGVGNYHGLPAVPAASPSARAIAKALYARQFQVVLKEEPTKDLLNAEINKFLQELQPGDTGFLYFAGYTVQDMGDNFLLPGDFDPASSNSLELRYSVKRLFRFLGTKKLLAGVVILDAAPGNATLDKLFPEPGLVSINLPSGNLVLAMPNLPGRGVSGPRGAARSRYSDAWVSAIEAPGLTLEAALRRIKQQVSQASNGEQVPSEITTLLSDFAFQTRTPADVEWDRLANSRDAAALEAFRVKYPADPRAREAAAKIQAMEWDNARSSGDLKTVRAFLARYPAHTEARQWLAGAETAEKGKAASAIAALLQRSSQAFSSRDIGGLQALEPGMSPEKKKLLERNFREFKMIQYELKPAAEPVIDSTVATVNCRLTMEMRGGPGRVPPVNETVSVKLSQQAGNWTIVSIQ